MSAHDVFIQCGGTSTSHDWVIVSSTSHSPDVFFWIITFGKFHTVSQQGDGGGQKFFFAG